MDDEIHLQENLNKQIATEIGYIVPFWSCKPLHKFSLDVWREGTILDTIDLNKKEFYIIGRNKQVCEIYMNNMTVSRTHCVIQHKDNGEIFLYDLDSVYGTSINKKQIAKKTYVKLNVGDTFKIGQSGKMFILNGPAELLPEEQNIPGPLISNKQVIEKRINQIKNLHQEQVNYTEELREKVRTDVTWGQNDYDEEIMDYQNEEENNVNNEDNLYGITNLEEIKDRRNLTDKQMNMLDKIDNFKKGIEKLKNEMLKIKKKEEDAGELTENQKKRLDICEKKILELSDKLEMQEDTLRISLSSKDGLGGNETKFNKEYLKELNSDEDEFYDRSRYTQPNKKLTVVKEVITENYETLKAKLENLIRNRQKLFDKLQKVGLKTDKQDDDIDPLDDYFRDTENKIMSDDKTIITQQIADISKEIKITQEFISHVTPSHIKIKYKSPDEMLKEHFKPVEVRKDELELKKRNITSIADTLQQFNKFKKKLADQKFVDSDEEIIDEINNYKDNLTKEIYDEDFMQKKMEFKKAMMKNNSDFDEGQGGGLIKPKSYFEEIVEHIGEEYNPSKYTGIHTALEQRSKKQDIKVDYSTGGLQTFNKEVEFIQRKRDRPENERQKIIYGPSMKPEDRNVEEMADEEYDDFDPITRFKREHDISGNPYMNLK
jgi:hypothetical protein